MSRQRQVHRPDWLAGRPCLCNKTETVMSKNKLLRTPMSLRTWSCVVHTTGLRSITSSMTLTRNRTLNTRGPGSATREISQYRQGPNERELEHVELGVQAQISHHLDVVVRFMFLVQQLLDRVPDCSWCFGDEADVAVHEKAPASATRLECSSSC